jgi:hypothetical protein
MLKTLIMTNETYNILNLIVNIFIAFGTVSAVILSLYLTIKRKEIIKIVNVNFSKTNKEWRNPNNREEILHEMDFYINIDLICENYIDKTIEIYAKKLYLMNSF